MYFWYIVYNASFFLFIKKNDLVCVYDHHYHVDNDKNYTNLLFSSENLIHFLWLFTCFLSSSNHIYLSTENIKHIKNPKTKKLIFILDPIPSWWYLFGLVKSWTVLCLC